MVVTYDPVWFSVTSQSAVCPTDGLPAIEARAYYQDGEPFGLQFRCSSLHTWEILFTDLSWYDSLQGIGGRTRAALHLLILALRVLASRLPAPDLILPFSGPTPVPPIAPSDPSLLPNYLNTYVRPYITALVQETDRTVNAAISVINGILKLISQRE